MAKISIINKFGITPNALLNRNDISLKAKGLYSYIQSKPENWSFSVQKMSSQLKEGIDAIKVAVKELEDNGYLVRKKNQNDSGFFDMEYYLFETPYNTHVSTENLIDSFEKNYLLENPIEGKSTSGKSFSGKSTSGKSTNLVKKNIVKKNIVKKSIELPCQKIEKIEKFSLSNDILTFFNEHCKKHSKLNGSNLKFLQARIKDGITLEDAVKVIKLKKWEWENTEMEKYLQIPTLFNKEKCDKYLEQINDKNYIQRIADSKKNKQIVVLKRYSSVWV